MSTSCSPSKRPRTDCDEDSNEIVKSKYWFDDGNVILQAENTQFRVHRSVLSNHSIVFKDMFTMPQPATLDPVVEGCPVVLLSDKAADVEHVMSLFYESFKIHDMRDLMPFSSLAAILRIGKKYQIDHLQAEGLLRLRTEFPNDLGTWDANFEKELQLAEVAKNCENIINLAHEASVQTVLPAAYVFYLSIATMEDIIHGREQDPEENSEVNSEAEGESEGAPRLLNEKAVQGCLKGRERLIRRFIEIVTGWLIDPGIIPASSCLRGSTCLIRKNEAILKMPGMNLETINIFDPLEVTYTTLICLNCISSLQSHYNAAREQIWDELPTYFDLPDWDELEDFA